jgi:glycosyltransferase involved in cell wall biosynthesis
LKKEGVKVELIFFKDVPNKTLLYYLAQADIVVDMLTLGWFGANVREAMMMGKPSICFLRQEWLDSMHKEIPEYIDELPVISATPETVYEVLKHLIGNAEERQEIGRRSREFAVKWHSGEAGAKRFDQIYSALLSNRVV